MIVAFCFCAWALARWPFVFFCDVLPRWALIVFCSVSQSGLFSISLSLFVFVSMGELSNSHSFALCGLSTLGVQMATNSGSSEEEA